eukprot:GEMP01069839.1.p1 GENE.GEMP01069839.1~~GEMP01069839.1.p1  ORF type:complete len:280 (+),score=45.89 GEMP01069839.1:294-1133(+)
MACRAWGRAFWSVTTSGIGQTIIGRPLGLGQTLSVRTLSQVRANKFTGVTAVKKAAPKTDWQLLQERKFLQEREKIPDGFQYGFTADDLRNLPTPLQEALTLYTASSKDKSKWRKQQLIRKFQRHATDHTSPAVRIACLTEKILNLRTHLLKNPKEHQAKRWMQFDVSKRTRAMKSLYKSDFTLYKWVCLELGIKCIRFAVPDFPNPTQMIAPLAIDGDRAKFLIRQKVWKAKYRPRPLRDPKTGQLIRYTTHPIEAPDHDHGLAKAVKQQLRDNGLMA